MQGTRGDKSVWRVSTCITSRSPSETTVANSAPDLHPDLGYEEGNAGKASVKEML